MKTLADGVVETASLLHEMEVTLKTLCSPLGAGSVSWRSHTCGELRSTDVGKAVTLCGWLQYKRFDFMVTLRDSHGVTQIVLPEDKVRTV